MTQELQYPACNFHLKKDYKKNINHIVEFSNLEF